MRTMLAIRNGALVGCLLAGFLLPARAELLQVELTVYGMD
jgi:hypothetical protein